MSEWHGRGGWDEDIPKSSRGSQMRFWMKSGESKRLIILDDEPFRVREHSVWRDRHPSFYVCVRGWPDYEKGCPLCVLLDKAGKERAKEQRVLGYSRYEMILRCLDLSGFTDDEGKQYQNIPKLIVCGTEDWDRLKARRKRLIDSGKITGMRGCEFTCHRSSSKKSSRMGEEWDFEKQHTDDELVELFGEKLDKLPEDLGEVFKALEYVELVQVADALSDEVLGEEHSNVEDDGVPF